MTSIELFTDKSDSTDSLTVSYGSLKINYVFYDGFYSDCVIKNVVKCHKKIAKHRFL